MITGRVLSRLPGFLQITNKLKQNYENICNTIVERFVKKHGYEFNYWVSGEVGGVACFINQYFLEYCIYFEI